MSLRKEKWRESLFAYLFLLPSLVLFGIFIFYPMLRSFYFSLHLTDPRGRIAHFVGLENFVNLFQDPNFYGSLRVTILFMLLTVPTCIAISTVMAALTNNKMRGMKSFQWIFSMPVVVSVATGSTIWLLLYHPSIGMFNYFLSLLGIDPIFWLASTDWALISVSLVTIWMNIGFAYIVILGGMKSISQDIYESAMIDGSGPFYSFFRITLPLLSPTYFFLTIVSIIGSFQAFGQIYILTRGGPSRSTNVIVFDIYQEAFINFQFGTASAKALVLFAIILVLTILQFRFGEKKVHYQ